jgi:hypothetical protein
MRKEDVIVGKTYTDGKGNVRKVLAAGPEFVLYPTQIEKDNLRYQITAKKSGPYRFGDLRNSTRVSFANWAKEEVEER